jgi:hypothetical protein
MESVPILESRRGFVNFDLSLPLSFFAHGCGKSSRRLHKADAGGRREKMGWIEYAKGMGGLFRLGSPSFKKLCIHREQVKDLSDGLID